MIHIDRSKFLLPVEIESEEFKKLIEILLKEKGNHDFGKSKKYIKLLSAALNSLYHEKCGYCETPINAGEFIRVDHYRPKGKVSDDGSHPGYYWLYYEWTNLIPVCERCNTYKSFYFPIDTKGKRLTEPPTVNGCLDMVLCRVDSEIHIAEKPLLLHPEVDKPEEHLIFLPDGKVRGISSKGNVTIYKCQLNRKVLIVARKEVFDKLFKEVITHLQNFSKNKINKDTLFYTLTQEFIKIKRAGNPQKKYSRFGWFLFEEFETFFIQRLREKGKNESAQVLEEAFSAFLKK